MVAIVMSTIRVREKRQITIPSDIGIKAGIEPNDILEVEITTGRYSFAPCSFGHSRTCKQTDEVCRGWTILGEPN
jgi:AbrB family looped-hinge helix DNA binding protein